MKTYTVHAKSIVPMLLNQLKVEMLDPSLNGNDGKKKARRGKEDEYERNHWRDKMTVVDGHVVIPSDYVEKMLIEAAQGDGRKIPGMGQATYTKYFRAAVFVGQKEIVTNVKPDTVEAFVKPVCSQGAKKGGKVLRYRPMLQEWEATFTVLVAHPLITDQVFAEIIDYGGKFVAIGDWRPKFGRVQFTVYSEGQQVEVRPLSEVALGKGKPDKAKASTQVKGTK